MTKMYKFWIGLVVGLAVMICLDLILRKEPSEVIMHDTISIQFDSIQVRDSIVYKWKKSDPIIFKSVDTLFAQLNSADSMRIAQMVFADLNSYNDTLFYRDTLKNDSSAFIQLTEKVSRNRINGRELVYRNNLKQYVPRKNGLYGQVEAGKEMLNLGLRLELGQKFDYIAGYNLIGNNFFIGIGFHIR